MPTVAHVKLGHQSQGGFENSNSSAYFPAALTAASWTQTGRGMLKAEVERRLPGWTLTNLGENFPGTPTTGEGGTSWVNDTIDPTVAPGDDTPLTGNTDARLTARGQTYMAALDTLIAANPTVDAWSVERYFYTWDLDEVTGRNRVNQCRAEHLWGGLVNSKLAATGKPYRMWLTSPGFSDRSAGTWAVALLHDVHNHVSQNGLRSLAPELAGFGRIPNLYLLAGANQTVSFNDAEEADTGVVVSPTTDRAHQCVASTMRLARHRALVIARWLDPLVAQEYAGAPYVRHAFIKPGDPFTVRVRVAITPGNRLVWEPRHANDAASVSIEQGGLTNPNDSAQIMVSAHRIYTDQPAGFPTRPERMSITAIAVDNSTAALGYAHLDVTCALKPTLGTCFHIQPGIRYREYTRKFDGTATTATRLLTGLREEAGPTPYTINAACADVLTPGLTFLNVLPVTNVPVLLTDPGA